MDSQIDEKWTKISKTILNKIVTQISEVANFNLCEAKASSRGHRHSIVIFDEQVKVIAKPVVHRFFTFQLRTRNYCKYPTICEILFVLTKSQETSH